MVSRSQVRPTPVGSRTVAPDGIDRVACARGMWCGFGVLVIGALLQPIVAVAAPLPGASVLLITALIAFVVAGSRIGSARFPVLQGAVAAVASYALVLPLVLLSSTEVGPSQVLTTAGVAVAVGSVAGFGAHLLRKRGRNA